MPQASCSCELYRGSGVRRVGKGEGKPAVSVRHNCERPPPLPLPPPCACSTASQLTGDTLAALLLSFSRLFVLSLLLGTGVGLASAALIKHAFVRHSTDREVTLLALCGALAFLAAEGLGLSGIFSGGWAGRLRVRGS